MGKPRDIRNIRAAQERNARRTYELMSRQQHTVTYNFHGPIHVYNHPYFPTNQPFQQATPIQTPIPPSSTTMVTPTAQATHTQHTPIPSPLTPMQTPTIPKRSPTPTFRDYSNYKSPSKFIKETIAKASAIPKQNKQKKKVSFSLPKHSSKSPKTFSPTKNLQSLSAKKDFQLPRLPNCEAEMTIVANTVNAPPIPNLLNKQHTIPRIPRKTYSKIRKVTFTEAASLPELSCPEDYSLEI